MAGHGYSIFDTALGRCGIAWGDLGVVGVQLPEAREIDTRRRLFQLYPDARELRPPPNAEIAIEGIVALLRGGGQRPLRRHARHDRHSALQPARLRVRPHHSAWRDPHLCRGRSGSLRASGAVYSVAQAIGRNPFMIIVPCHRVLEAGHYADKISPNGGAISKRRLLSIEGTQTDHEQDAVRRAAAGCAAPRA